jgi:hypothetical protein
MGHEEMYCIGVGSGSGNRSGTVGHGSATGTNACTNAGTGAGTAINWQRDACTGQAVDCSGRR